MRYPVFVYGTLKRGYGLHDSIVQRYGDNYRFESEAATQEGFGLYSLGAYPLLIDSDQTPKQFQGTVSGEIFLASLDAIRDLAGVEMGAGYLPVGIDVWYQNPARPPSLAALAWLYPGGGYDDDRWVRPEDGNLIWNRRK